MQTTIQPLDGEFFTLRQAAAQLKCNPATLSRAIRLGALKAGKVGRDYRVSRAALETYLKAETK